MIKFEKTKYFYFSRYVGDSYSEVLVFKIKRFALYRCRYIKPEKITHLGQSPNIIYDDNGLFAVTSDGFQTVVTGNKKIEGSFLLLVEKKQWKKNIREALKQYLK